jgi:hypothetical protein
VTAGIRKDLQTKRFWRRVGVQSFAAVGFMAVLAGLYDVIEPDAISKIHLPLSLIVIAAAVTYGIIRAWPRPVEQHFAASNTTIRVRVGDLFSCDTNLVVGVCDTFDTATPHIIQENSIQGQFLEKIYRGDRTKLDQDLEQALIGVSPIEVVTKTGKTARYPIGTVATIRNHRIHYFCAAYTSMNDQNQAEGTPDRLWKSLLELWDSVRLHTNGDALSIPVIGGGQSRMSSILPAQDSIRFIILSFIFASRKARVCERLDIVVRPEDAERIDMPELQAFLTSLKPS